MCGKFGLHNPNRLGKNVRKFQGGGFFTHTVHTPLKIICGGQGFIYTHLGGVYPPHLKTPTGYALPTPPPMGGRLFRLFRFRLFSPSP